MTNDEFSLISPHLQQQLLIQPRIEFPVTNLTTSNLIFADIGDVTPEKYDVMADAQKAFKHFVDSGQVWALLIGIFVGYIFKSLTSY